MVQLLCCGPGASHWHGTLQYRTHTQMHMWPTQPGKQEWQPVIQQSTRSPNSINKHTHIVSGGHWNSMNLASSNPLADKVDREKGNWRNYNVTTYLFQQLLVALQGGNAVSFQNMFTRRDLIDRCEQPISWVWLMTLTCIGDNECCFHMTSSVQVNCKDHFCITASIFQILWLWLFRFFCIITRCSVEATEY